LPESLKEQEAWTNIEKVQNWAISKGYDLMGDEVTIGDRTFSILRPIGMKTWELPNEPWKSYSGKESYNDLTKRGHPVEAILASHDLDNGAAKYEDTATFFYVTADGSPGLLNLGVQITRKWTPGHKQLEDWELDPVGLFLGRRFGLTILTPEE
jgi:hypothetical protein